MSRENPTAIIKGAGDLGTGIAFRLHKAGFRVLCTDLEKPLVIRRMVAFASAIYSGRISVEGRRRDAHQLCRRGCLPLATRDHSGDA